MKLTVKSAADEQQKIKNRISFLQKEQAKYMKRIELARQETEKMNMIKQKKIEHVQL